MAKNKDILVGLTLKPNAEPKEITESFDGENEGVDYSKLTDAYSDLEKDLKKNFKTLSAETAIIGVKSKSFK